MRNCTKIFALGLVVIFSTVNFTSLVNAVPKVGEEAPKFKVNDINNRRVELHDFLGKIIVMEWHNPECPFVRKHYNSNNIQRLQKKYVSKGVIWLTINSSAEGKQGNLTSLEAREYLKENSAIPSHYILDSSGKIGKLFGVRTTPQIVIISSDGEISYQGAVDDQDSTRVESVLISKNYIEQTLSSLRSGKKPKIVSTEPYGCSVKYAS